MNSSPLANPPFRGSLSEVYHVYPTCISYHVYPCPYILPCISYHVYPTMYIPVPWVMGRPVGHGPQCLISGISLHKTEGSFQVELNKLGTDELTVSRNDSLEVKRYIVRLRGDIFKICLFGMLSSVYKKL